jgi:hypothetical protein
MFVITADQVASRRTPDAVGTTLTRLMSQLGDSLVIAPERTAGDEFQALIAGADATLDAVLTLCRDGAWSVGLGVGEVHHPLPDSIREATGNAFIGARGAVERAKKKPSRFAVEAPGFDAPAGRFEALVDLLLATRARRSDEGWELFDLVTAGLTQGAAAGQLGISPQAASLRAQAADLKLDASVTAALASLLEELDATSKERA